MKTCTPAELSALEKQHALPPGWFTDILTKYGPIILSFLVMILGDLTPPASAKALKAPKACPTPLDCCCGACVSAASGIISMHGQDYASAGESFFLAACYAARAGDPDCGKA